MDKSNKESSLDSIKLTYNEKSKRIVANLITDVDGVKVSSRTINNFDDIKVLLDALGKQAKLSISELIDLGIITVDSRLLDPGVVIFNSSKEYQKYLFDKDSGSFISTRLTRAEQKELGLREDFGIYRSEMPEEETTHEEKITHEEEITHKDEVILEEEITPEDENIHEDEVISVERTVPEEHVVEVEEKKEKGTKNLKLYKRAFAILGVTAIVLVGSLLANKKKSDRTIDYVPNNDTNVEDQQDIIINDVDSYNDSSNYSDNNYNNSSAFEETYVEDVRPKIDYVNTICGTLEPCVFYDLVDSSDRQTLKIINDARNAAINDNEKLFDVMDQYAKYVFEGSTMFNGNAVKGYYYVSPLSRYIILTSGQTLLQLCPDYNYSTAVNIYTFNNLMSSFDELIDETYRELMVIDKTK